MKAAFFSRSPIVDRSYMRLSVSRINIKRDKMIILGSMLTTFELSSIFGGSWGSIENWLEPKIEPPSGN